jgi:plasmid stability protein
MATLYVENVPGELYEALRARARVRRRSIAAEVLVLLEENIPTEKELKARREFVRKLSRLDSGNRSAKAMPTAEQMVREDRKR